MSNWSDAIRWAAAEKRNKYQGARPLALLSPKQRRQLTTQKAQRIEHDREKTTTEKLASTLKTLITGVKHGKS
jgi:hypothetical protein